MFHLVGAYRDLVKSSPPFPYKALCGFGSRTPDAQKNKMLNPRRLLRACGKACSRIGCQRSPPRNADFHKTGSFRVTDEVSANDDPAEERRQRTFDRRYRLLELKERRADRAAKLQEVEINRTLKEKELQANEGRGIKFTSSQATVAAAAIALFSGVLGGAIQGYVTRGVEADKAKANIEYSDSQWTRRWREMDSNPRSPVRRLT
jgi:hypothetical protein